MKNHLLCRWSSSSSSSLEGSRVTTTPISHFVFRRYQEPCGGVGVIHAAMIQNKTEFHPCGLLFKTLFVQRDARYRLHVRYRTLPFTDGSAHNFRRSPTHHYRIQSIAMVSQDDLLTGFLLLLFILPFIIVVQQLFQAEANLNESPKTTTTTTTSSTTRQKARKEE